MKIPVRIPASQLVFKKLITPSVLDTPTPKVSLPIPSVPVAALDQASMSLNAKAVSPAKSSVPWDAILIGVGVLVVVGVIYYQIEKRRTELDRETY
ncbi:MAG: hypothetical protein P8H33_00850 [Crocinitomicaceae bacterium]|nr:hypothetical protein [Crocinitomicaceae bacterium]MDG1037237.1 hypothetical protein [Crocinitomicaceae bacterium]MDG1775916.1 hypothetical protein [Crocinitomicaceae bacterium]